MAAAMPARSANPSLPEAEVRMGEGRSEGAKARPYKILVEGKAQVRGQTLTFRGAACQGADP